MAALIDWLYSYSKLIGVAAALIIFGSWIGRKRATTRTAAEARRVSAGLRTNIADRRRASSVRRDPAESSRVGEQAFVAGVGLQHAPRRRVDAGEKPPIPGDVADGEGKIP